MPAALVILRVLVAIGVNRCRHTLDQLLLVLVGRIELQHQRTDLGAQEMVGTGGAEPCQAFEGLAVDEVEHRGAVIEMAYLARVG